MFLQHVVAQGADAAVHGAAHQTGGLAGVHVHVVVQRAVVGVLSAAHRTLEVPRRRAYNTHSGERELR